MKVQIKHTALCESAEEGMDAFLKVIVDAIRQEAGGELNAESMASSAASQSAVCLICTFIMNQFDR